MKERQENPENRRETGRQLPPVEHRFQPGQSGNAGGRPKKLLITDYLKAQLEMTVPAAMLERLNPADETLVTAVLGAAPSFGQLVALRLIQQTLKGDVFALRELLDRVEGKATQKVSSEDGGPIQFVLTRAGGKVLPE